MTDTKTNAGNFFEDFRFGQVIQHATPRTVTDGEWTAYLYERNNPRGAANEIWMHMTCGEIFRMERDTVHHRVAQSFALGEGDGHDGMAY